MTDRRVGINSDSWVDADPEFDVAAVEGRLLI